MKIAVVTDDGKTVSRHFARAKYYLVYDLEAGGVKGGESRPKASRSPDHGALHQREKEVSLREEFVSDVRGCEAVIAGGMGRKMYDAFLQAGVRPYVTKITRSEEVVDAYINGELDDQPPVEGALLKVAVESMKDEAKDRAIYEALAKAYRGSNHRYTETFRTLAATEQKHYDFWKGYAGGREAKPSRLATFFILNLRLLMGTTFAIRFLERHEANTIARYRAIAPLIPEDGRGAFQDIIADEMSNERSLRDRVEGPFVKYISFVILGLADAIVEISGIHAGSLGIYNSTELTGMAGIVAGAAASIAMASAAYAQAKQGFRGSAPVSASFTGASYFVSAAILAGPYFLTGAMVTAMAVSLTFGIVMVMAATYYNSVVSGKRFIKDFAELVAIMLAATAALYLFGDVVRVYTGIAA